MTIDDFEPSGCGFDVDVEIETADLENAVVGGGAASSGDCCP